MERYDTGAWLGFVIVAAAALVIACGNGCSTAPVYGW